MTSKKYEMLPKDYSGLCRIKALRSFGDVKAGDLGGFIQFEHNLSHEGDCWVFDDTRVYGDARLTGNTQVFGKAWVFGEARVSRDTIETNRKYEHQ